MKLITPILISVALSALTPCWGEDEALAPDGTQSSDSNTSCDASVHGTIDDDPDSPGGDWCTADNNNVDWTFTVTFPTPTDDLDETVNAQVIEFYVRSFDEAQSGNPQIQVDIYDGTNCADLHATGTPITLTDAGYPAKASQNWTASGISSGADVCAKVSCTKAGGSPSNRNSCDIDAIEWDVTWAIVGQFKRTMFFF